MAQLSAVHSAIADCINDFKFNTLPNNMSPPMQAPEQLVVRNLAIIDLTNKIADTLRVEDDLADKDAFLKLALSKRN